MATKMTNCKACNAEIAASAKTCPSCGAKNKKPIFKKWWFWVIIVIVAIAIIANLGGDKTGSSAVTTTVAADSDGIVTTEKTDAKQKSEATEPTTAKVSAEFKNALKSAESYAKIMHMSKRAIYDQLTSEYGEKFPEDAAQYAIDNMKADWNANALATAKSYQQTMSMSTSAIYDQLISEYGEKFTEEEAQYAIDHLDD